MPVHNGGNLLHHSIKSILNQDFSDFEFIIINDGSTDNSWKTIQSYARRDPRIVATKNLKKLGLAKSLNLGIKLARSNLIVRMDHDDESLPHRLSIQYQFMKQHADIAVCGSFAYHMGKTPNNDVLVTLPTNPSEIRRRLLNVSNCIYHPTVIMRRNIILKEGGYRENFKNSEEYDLWLRISQKYKIANINSPLLRYKISVNGQTVGKKWEQLYYVYLAYEQHRHPQLKASIIKRMALKDLNTHKKTDFLYAQYRHYFSQLVGLKQYGDALSLIKRLPHDIGLTNTFKFTLKMVIKTLKNRFFHPSPVDCALNPKNVLLALPFLVLGGGTKRFKAISQLLRTKGYKIHIITTVPFSDSDLVDITSEFTNISNNIYHLPILFDNPRDWKKFVINYIKTNHIGTIILGGSRYFYDLLPTIKCLFRQIRIFDQQFNLAEHFISNREYAHCIDHTICENQDIVDKLVNEYHENANKVSLITNGVDTKQYSRQNVHCSNPINNSQGKTIISFIGRLSEEKGPDIFIDIAKHFKKNNQLLFVLAGVGPERLHCQNLIKKYQLDNVLMPGLVDSKKYLKFTDILLLPSRIDGRPNIILESLSMGTPTIAFNVGGVAEIIKNGSTGYVCANPQDMIKKIEYLIKHPQKLKNMKNDAQDYAHKNLDDNKEITKYLSILK